MSTDASKYQRAKDLGIYRGFLYYKPKKPEQDWKLKCQIEEVLRIHSLSVQGGLGRSKQVQESR